MSILLLLVPLSVMLLGIAVCAFAWSVKRGQFDDLDAPALDVLVDDDKPARSSSAKHATERDDHAG